MVVSGDDVAITRPAKHDGFTTQPQTLIITEVGAGEGGVAGFFYVKENVNSSFW